MSYLLVLIKTILSASDLVLALLFLVTFLLVPVLAIKETFLSPLGNKFLRFLKMYFGLGFGFSILYLWFNAYARLSFVVFAICFFARVPNKYKLWIIAFAAYGSFGYFSFEGRNESHTMPLFSVMERSYTHTLLPDSLKTIYTKDFMEKTKLHEKIKSQKPVHSELPPYSMSINYRIEDAWSNPIKYRPSADQRSYNLISSGPDIKEGTEDDIVLSFK